MVVLARRYGGAAESDDASIFDADAELERAMADSSSRGLAPILEPDDDYDDFDASEFVGRAQE